MAIFRYLQTDLADIFFTKPFEPSRFFLKGKMGQKTDMYTHTSAQEEAAYSWAYVLYVHVCFLSHSLAFEK